MDRHPAVTALEQACPRLNIPKSAALELVRFLFVKKFNEDDASFNLSPSRKIDLLWHEMLLNTDLRYKGNCSFRSGMPARSLLLSTGSLSA